MQRRKKTKRPTTALRHERPYTDRGRNVSLP
jgi:hypothetical protein